VINELQDYFLRQIKKKFEMEQKQAILNSAFQSIEMGQSETGTLWPVGSNKNPYFIKAQNSFLKVLKTTPKNLVANVNLAMYYLDHKSIGKSLKHIKIALAENSNVPEIQFLLGQCMDEQQKPREAISAYKEAVRLNPKFFEAALNLALNLRITGQSTAAIQAFTHVLNLNPSHRNAHEHFGMTLLENGNHLEGLRELAKGVGFIEFQNNSSKSFCIFKG
tara:strand:- start:2739 stop:3398 length:660 start_codon:yes stop_codon:yes gene_type:complete